MENSSWQHRYGISGQICISTDVILVQAPQNSPSNTTPKPSLENGVQGDTVPEPEHKLKRRASFKKSWGRARSKVSSALLGGSLGLRSYIDEQPVVKGVDHSMAIWRSFMAEREHLEVAMEGSFDSFQDAMEAAMDSKYRELRGEGSFLIYEAASSSLAKPLYKFPTEDEAVECTPEVRSWVKYAIEEEERVEVCKPQLNGIQQHGLTLRPEPPAGVTIAEPGDAASTSRDGDHQPTASNTQMSNGHRKVPDPTNARSAGLPVRTSSVRRKPIPGREAVTMLASTTQTAESSRIPVPSKGRQDSAQTVVPQTAAAQAVARQSAQEQDIHPLFRRMDRKQDLQ